MKIAGVFLCLLMVSCSANELKPIDSTREESVESSTENSIKEMNPEEKNETTEKLKTEFKKLYKELIKFKKEKDFHELGFGVGSPYKKWFDEVDLLSNNPNCKLLLKFGVLPGELKTLGTEYLQSRGRETEYTTFINSEIKRNFKD
ncbi:MAG: hypothetical protein RL037_1763 [Bacteroidota bacterium]